MGRRQFRQDLSSVIQRPPRFVSNIETSDDGEISFKYDFSTSGLNQTADLQLLALNVDEYPDENDYMIYVRDGDSDVDSRIINTFDLICPLIRNKSIQNALQEISDTLHQALTSGQAYNPILLSQSSGAENTDAEQGNDTDDNDSADEWFGADDDATFGFDEPRKTRPLIIGRNPSLHFSSEETAKIKSDLRQVKDAGFKVGIFNDLTASGIICISIRISKLGISEEVMKAWSLEPQQYFVLLVRCLQGYRTIESLQEEPQLIGATEIRLGLCSSYKPNIKSAIEAFTDASQDFTKAAQYQVSTKSDDLQPLFISRPLNDLFKSRFTRIVKFREVYSLSWSGAEQLVHDTQGAIIDTGNMDRYDRMYDDTDRALPPIVLADIMSEKRLKHCSMPLVAMQFALRHFVRCTEFCLVCHCSSGSTFEALKPYVCSNPLCLFQYMTLGFGPSIEWEILSQPYVVDLLVSFCYAQAQAHRLRSFPVGINLQVPFLPRNHAGPQTYPTYPTYPHTTTPDTPNGKDPVQPIKVRYNGHKRELLFESTTVAEKHGLKTGDFIAVVGIKTIPGTSQSPLFYRIEEVMLPAVRLSKEIDSDELTRALPDNYTMIECYPFNNNFDELSDDHKSRAILTLLDTIPPVKEMEQYLMKHSIGQNSELRHWRDRISPAALNILRWIIASNRSCIMQVDTVLADGAAKSSESREDRVSGMDEYMQFRFAQGAPDKEQRFVDCVQKHATSKDHPTIFAWHGSPLSNWHSIIREGLDFKEVMHGRAYGNGVYMSCHAQTSIGYTNMRHASPGDGWPNSELKITSAMSLNEVVNNPGKFISRAPHLVVADTDWIQTRYLLVKTSALHSKSQHDEMEKISQDAGLTAMGVGNAKVEIPVTAVSKSRRPVKEATKHDSRKRKSIGSGLINEPIQLIDSDDESVATLDDDRDYLIDDESHSGRTPIELDSDVEMAMDDFEQDHTIPPRKKMRPSGLETTLPVVDGLLIDVSKTDFFPGKLDLSNVQILPPPNDATTSASKSLLKAFNALLKTQKTSPAHELGWYINPEQIENMYQWIVELHSFDKNLPLAQDMKTADLTSVVLEMRFTNSWPYAPPFVRVVKPRFLPFSQRGGGHVTEGGAICMELLTNSGWSAVSSIESVLLQVRLAMSDREPPARLATIGRYGSSRDGVYGVGEAIAAYERACRNHGWTIPPAFAHLQRQ